MTYNQVVPTQLIQHILPSRPLRGRTASEYSGTLHPGLHTNEDGLRYDENCEEGVERLRLKGEHMTGTPLKFQHAELPDTSVLRTHDILTGTPTSGFLEQGGDLYHTLLETTHIYNS